MNTEILEICQQAETGFQQAVSNPIWQLLFLENPGFATELPSNFKLLLLHSIFLKFNQLSVPDEQLFNDEGEQDQVLAVVSRALERLGDIEVDIDPWETEWPGVTYTDEDTDLERRFEIGNGWSLDVRFADCDIEMKDVEYGCDERLSLRQWLEGFFEDPTADIRTFAEACDLSYEPAMSPESGFYFRFCGFLLTHTSGDWSEIEAHELGNIIESDQKLAQQLQGETEILKSEDLQLIKTAGSGLRPIFDAPPSVDEETRQHSDAYEWYSPEGIISLSWKCNCWLPVKSGGVQATEQEPNNSMPKFVKQPLDIAFDAHGNSEGSYEIVYSRHRVSDAKEEMLKQLNNDRLHSLYLYALGLPVIEAN